MLTLFEAAGILPHPVPAQTSVFSHRLQTVREHLKLAENLRKYPSNKQKVLLDQFRQYRLTYKSTFEIESAMQ